MFTHIKNTFCLSFIKNKLNLTFVCLNLELFCQCISNIVFRILNSNQRLEKMMKHLPPKPSKKIPPLPPFKQKMFSEKDIDPEVGQIAGLQKQFHSKKDLRRDASVKSLKLSIKYRPISASSLKTRGSSKDSLASSQSTSKQGVLKNPPKLSSFNWGIFQIKSGTYLSGLRTEKRREFASLTKIMNLTTILNILSKLELAPAEIRVRVTEAASKINGTTAALKKGTELTLQNLFYAMMLPSGNDAAYLIAQVGGAILKLFKEQKCKKQFIYNLDFLSSAVQDQGRAHVIRYLTQMNSLSQILGLSKSKWSNPHGLSNKENVSTIQDLALLCTHSMKNPKFRQIVNTKQYSCIVEARIEESKQNCEDNGQDKSTQKLMGWANTNKMLWKGWNGIKTGITPNAGPCLASTINKVVEGKEYEFLVILGGCMSMEKRWEQVNELVDWALQDKDKWSS